MSVSLTKLFFRMEPCAAHRAMVTLTTAPVVKNTVLSEGQDVTVTLIFTCVFLNINKQMFFRAKRNVNKPCSQGFSSWSGSCSCLWHHREKWDGGQVFLAPRSSVFPTKHVVYLRGWHCQVHAMLLPPVKFPSSAYGENFTSLKGSCWDPGHAFMAAIQISC